MSDGQDLAAALLELPGMKVRSGPACSIAVLLEQLDGQDAAAAGALRAVVDSDAVAPSALARTLSARGHRLAPNTIRRHRRRLSGDGCACLT